MVSNWPPYVKNDWHFAEGNRRSDVVETNWIDQSSTIGANPRLLIPADLKSQI
jgi:hypothetical protein